MRKLMLVLLTFALAVASAAGGSYRLKINSPTWVAGTELPVGTYSIQVDGTKAVITKGKKMMVEVPASMEEMPDKYRDTTVVLNGTNAQRPVLQEVHVGGTHTRILIQN